MTSPITVSTSSTRTHLPTRGVLFDLDGTLIDSRYAIIESYRATFENELGRPLPAELEDPSAIMAPRPPEIFARFADEDPLELERAYGRHYTSDAFRRVTPYPGLRETLSALTERGITVGIVTNKRMSRVSTDFDHLGIDPATFATVVTADDTAERKPHPAPVLLGLERAGLDPAHSWYVGDGPQDVLAGAAAGTGTMGAAYGYYGTATLVDHRPDHLLTTLPELLHLV
ncbi:HAD family hydrolase [Gordonia soli]|uniref:Putative pyrophosphatase n=1 Tax=Gordonia soli NBRC 108243 TaxID=1223545 RepID=M0QLW6_9ACTN|nr:HAD hydrolase-like protein [Gordonia soli]GAC68367.1 putative pyrophosphatase [Gordonia soli NBRC 108243]